MEQIIDLTGKLEFQVSYRREKTWRRVGGSHTLMSFPRKIDAEHAIQKVRELPDVEEVLIIRIETTYYSDIETRLLHKQIVYTGVR